MEPKYALCTVEPISKGIEIQCVDSTLHSWLFFPLPIRRGSSLPQTVSQGRKSIGQNYTFPLLSVKSQEQTEPIPKFLYKFQKEGAHSRGPTRRQKVTDELLDFFFFTVLLHTFLCFLLTLLSG